MPKAEGQCAFEWKPGEAIPGLNGGADVSLVWDDGSGPALYVGGSFKVAGNLVTNGIAKWNGSSWSALGSGVSGGASLTRVYAMTLFNSELIVGGEFTTAGGISANRIARWSGGAWSQVDMGGGMDGTVRSLFVWNGMLVAGGQFTNAGGVSANKVARLNGTSWEALGSGQTNDIWALTSWDPDGGGPQQPVLIAGGGSGSADSVSRWNGISWTVIGGPESLVDSGS